MQRLALLVEKENYSERRAVTGLHLAALRAGIRPPRIVSRVARTIRPVQPWRQTAVTLVVPAMEDEHVAGGSAAAGTGPTPITPEHIPIMKVSALNTFGDIMPDAPMAPEYRFPCAVPARWI